MNRFFTFIALFLIFATASAQTVIFSDNFDSYTAGTKLAANNPAWTTWNNSPGSDEDGMIVNNLSTSAPNSLRILQGNDQVYITPFGNNIAGHYQFSFNMFIPTGKEGYFNALHRYDPSGSCVWAYECFLFSDGSGILVAKDTIDFTFPINTWFPVVMDFDLSHDLTYLSVNNTVVQTWPVHYYANGEIDTSLLYCRKISVIDFFGADSNEYYIDDFVVTSLSGDFTVSHNSISLFHSPDSSLTQTITLTNNDNQPTDWQSLITYDIANPDTTSTGITSLTYVNDTMSFLTSVPTEYAVGFPSSMLQDHIGKTIQGIKFSWDKNGQYGADSVNVSIRIYSMNNLALSAGPGTPIYEKSIISTPGETYVPIDTQIVLDGSDLWVGVYWSSTNGILTTFLYDTLPNNGYRCWNRSYWGFYTWYKSSYIYPIEVCIDGTPIAPWLSIDADRGSINGGGLVEQAITANTNGMQIGEHHAAKLHLYSNSYNNSEKVIPITLDISHVSVNEHNEIEVKIFPNPTSDFMKITSEEILRVEVYNITGQKLIDNRYSGSHVVIPTSSLSAGTYIVNVTTSTGKTSKKVVVR